MSSLQEKEAGFILTVKQILNCHTSHISLPGPNECGWQEIFDFHGNLVGPLWLNSGLYVLHGLFGGNGVLDSPWRPGKSMPNATHLLLYNNAPYRLHMVRAALVVPYCCTGDTV